MLGSSDRLPPRLQIRRHFPDRFARCFGWALRRLQPRPRLRIGHAFAKNLLALSQCSLVNSLATLSPSGSCFVHCSAAFGSASGSGYRLAPKERPLFARGSFFTRSLQYSRHKLQTSPVRLSACAWLPVPLGHIRAGVPLGSQSRSLSGLLGMPKVGRRKLRPYIIKKSGAPLRSR